MRTKKKRGVVINGLTEEEKNAILWLIESNEKGVWYKSVPDWEVRLKYFKTIVSLLPKERKERIVNSLRFTDEGLTELGNKIIKYVDTSFIREGSRKKRWLILRRDKFTCQYCGTKAPEARLHIDHVIPVSKGGDNSDGNLVVACSKCNHGKNTDVI